MTRRRKAGPRSAGSEATDPQREPALRVIGGSLRGSKLLYSGDTRTRPMKDRVREAVFNLLGPGVAGKRAIDLFAGTGALGFEALSRGAQRATFVEQHFPTARIIQQNAALLKVTDRIEVHPGNAFIWAQRLPAASSLPADPPWVVFCSPPYAFYVERQVEMIELVKVMLQRAPEGSQLVVEADERFDMGLLPSAEDWEVRAYLPAVVAIYHKQPA